MVSVGDKVIVVSKPDQVGEVTGIEGGNVVIRRPNPNAPGFFMTHKVSADKVRPAVEPANEWDAEILREVVIAIEKVGDLAIGDVSDER